MDIKEIDRQLNAMEQQAKKLIDDGADKASFMAAISNTAAEMAGKNLRYAGYIVAEAKKRIANIAAYQGLLPYRLWEESEEEMKVKFQVREKLYADVDFEIECESIEQVEAALDQIGDSVSSGDLECALGNIFGGENVYADGVDSTENIYPADECEFQDWLE